MPRSVKEWHGKSDDTKPHTAVRLRLWDRCGGRCQGPCRRELYASDKWHLDHIIRLKDGGENRESNLQVLCEWCHQEKTGAENKSQAKANRVRARAIGIKKLGRPVPGSKNSPFARRWNKLAQRWETVLR